jgi:ligand-binding sensor domain-containing protein
MTRQLFLCLFVFGLCRAALGAPQWVATVADERNYAIKTHGDNLWIQKKYGVVGINTRTDKKVLYDSAGLDNMGDAAAIAIDTFGNPWAVTSSGIAWFNGLSWQRLDVAGSPVEGKRLWTICIDHKNRLWAATRDGRVALRDSSGWHAFDSSSFGVKPYWMYTIAEANDGKIWVSMDYQQILVYDNKGWTRYNSKNSGLFSGMINTITAGDSSDMWIAQDNGLSQLHNGKWYGYDMSNTMISSSYYNTVFMDPQKNIWVGTRDRVAKIAGGVWNVFPKNVARPSLQNCVGFAEDGNNSLWCIVAYGDSLLRYNGSNWADATLVLGDIDPTRPEVFISNFPNNCVEDLFEDRDGSIWFSTWYGYIIRLGKSGRTVWRVDSSSVLSNLNGIGQDAAGNIWVSKPLGGLVKYDGTTWQAQPSPIAGIQSVGVKCMLSERSGILWMGCENGLLKYDGASWQLINKTSAGDSIRSVAAIFKDQSGVLWLGAASSQVFTYDGKTASKVEIPAGLINYGIRALAVTPDSTLWVGTTYGAFSRKRNAWQTVTGLPQPNVNCMTVDKENAVWFGLIDSGAVRYDGKGWTRLFSNKYSDFQNTLSLLCDSHGNVWMGYLSIGMSVYNKDGVVWPAFTDAARPAGTPGHSPSGIARVIRRPAGCEIRYRQHEPGPSLMTVYSLSGAKIAVERDFHSNAGEFSFVWAGAGNGRLVPNGVYLVSIRAGSETFSVPVHIVKR